LQEGPGTRNNSFVVVKHSILQFWCDPSIENQPENWWREMETCKLSQSWTLVDVISDTASYRRWYHVLTIAHVSLYLQNAQLKAANLEPNPSGISPSDYLSYLLDSTIYMGMVQN
jgi:hypothetical protein